MLDPLKAQSSNTSQKMKQKYIENLPRCKILLYTEIFALNINRSTVLCVFIVRELFVWMISFESLPSTLYALNSISILEFYV